MLMREGCASLLNHSSVDGFEYNGTLWKEGMWSSD